MNLGFSDRNSYEVWEDYLEYLFHYFLQTLKLKFYSTQLKFVEEVF